MVPEPDFDQLYVELWVSLASLLRSYTAAHGLNRNTQATVELGEEQITVRHGDDWLKLQRDGAMIRWGRQNGKGGILELTAAGRLKRSEGDHEEEMDMVAEAWARELMA
ncbi:transcriptional regulator [Acidobacteria bacterium AB60]|nr:transcriptional regulator [Acidobacteria bacterium AB60]